MSDSHWFKESDRSQAPWRRFLWFQWFDDAAVWNVTCLDGRADFCMGPRAAADLERGRDADDAGSLVTGRLAGRAKLGGAVGIAGPGLDRVGVAGGGRSGST
ncbi:hypothetical protein GCM10010207_62370 [Streptomyces atratus]|nr:hypothetical protein GCM10010207_62370 [Streptomyces atratus]